MKKYIFEAAKKQLEKPTEPKYVFCPEARVSVFAESEAEAKVLAAAKLREGYLGTGFLTGVLRLAATADMAVDWNYGYGDARGTGTKEEQAALRLACTK